MTPLCACMLALSHRSNLKVEKNCKVNQLHRQKEGVRHAENEELSPSSLGIQMPYNMQAEQSVLGAASDG